MSERPYLVPALGVALALSTVAALQAFQEAKRFNTRTIARARGGGSSGGVRLQFPTVDIRPDLLQIHLLRLTF